MHADGDPADLYGDPSNDDLMAILERHGGALREHFPAIQIIAIAEKSDGDVVMFDGGEGNFYARFGAVREWLLRQETRMRTHARRESDDD